MAQSQIIKVVYDQTTHSNILDVAKALKPFGLDLKSIMDVEDCPECEGYGYSCEYLPDMSGEFEEYECEKCEGYGFVKESNDTDQ